MVFYLDCVIFFLLAGSRFGSMASVCLCSWSILVPSWTSSPHISTSYHPLSSCASSVPVRSFACKCNYDQVFECFIIELDLSFMFNPKSRRQLNIKLFHSVIGIKLDFWIDCAETSDRNRSRVSISNCGAAVLRGILDEARCLDPVGGSVEPLWIHPFCSAA